MRFLVAVLICASLRAQPRPLPPPIANAAQNQGAKPASPRAPITNSSEGESPSNRRIADYTQALALYTALLVGVGVLQFLALAVQSCFLLGSLRETRAATGLTRAALAETSRSNAATESAASAAVELTRRTFLLSHRPKLIVRNIGVASAGQPRIVLEKMPEELAQVRFFVANVGGVVGTITSWCGRVFINERLPLDSPCGTQTATNVHIPLSPGVDKQLEFRLGTAEDLWVRNTQPEQLNTGKRFLWVMGWIEYTDELGNSRRSAFCRQWDPSSLRFVPVADADYEHAD
jgi:hypothetical protein